MKVIFVQDVPKIARKGEVKDVSAGYAENFLLKKKLALVATPAILQRVEAENKKRAAEVAKAKVEAKQLAEALADYTLRIRRKSEKGKLFGAITVADIAELLGRDGYRVSKKSLKLERPIKMLGEYSVKADLGGGVQAGFSVVVSEE